MTFQLKRAIRQKTKLKMGIFGPSGSGKTYSALLLARGLAEWEKVAVIDTENCSADLYANLGAYNTIDLKAPYSPERYIEAIQECEKAGMEVIIIDSVSHEWDGTGGCLEIVDQLGGQFQHWKKVTPRHNKFIQAILQANCHVITTARKKQDYAMENDNGKTKVTKVGLKEVTREGFEYELTLAFDVNINHLASTSKDRTGLFMDKPEFVIGIDTGKQLMEWVESGADIVVTKPEPTTETPKQPKESTTTVNNFLNGPASLPQLEAIVKIYKEMGQTIEFGELQKQNWSKQKASDFIRENGNGGYKTAKAQMSK